MREKGKVGRVHNNWHQMLMEIRTAAEFQDLPNIHYYIKYYFLQKRPRQGQKKIKKNTLILFNFISPEILSSYWYKIFLTLDTPHPLSLSLGICHSISCRFTNKTRTKPHNKSSKIVLAEAEAAALV